MKITKISTILMIIGGVLGLAACFFDAMISYADTAARYCTIAITGPSITSTLWITSRGI